MMNALTTLTPTIAAALLMLITSGLMSDWPRQACQINNPVSAV